MFICSLSLFRTGVKGAEVRGAELMVEGKEEVARVGGAAMEAVARASCMPVR